MKEQLQQSIYQMAEKNEAMTEAELFIALALFAHLLSSTAIRLSLKTFQPRTNNLWFIGNIALACFMAGLLWGKMTADYTITVAAFFFAFTTPAMMQLGLTGDHERRNVTQDHLGISSILTITALIVTEYFNPDMGLRLCKFMLAIVLICRSRPYLKFPIQTTPPLLYFNLGIALFILVSEWVGTKQGLTSFEILFSIPFLMAMFVFFWLSPFLFIATENHKLLNGIIRQRKSRAIISHTLNTKNTRRQIVDSIFIDQIEHQVRQPLAAISMYAELLSRTHNHELVTKLLSEVNRLNHRVKSLATLYTDSGSSSDFNITIALEEAISAIKLLYPDQLIHHLKPPPPDLTVNGSYLEFSRQFLDLLIVLFESRRISELNMLCAINDSRLEISINIENHSSDVSEQNIDEIKSSKLIKELKEDRAAGLLVLALKPIEVTNAR